MENGLSLCDAKICRLCGENNAIGSELFNENDAEMSLRLTGLINHYLPVKVSPMEFVIELWVKFLFFVR